ncbi:hypothetical protein [Micromonospora sp. CB01531]|uniref:hypothetical protein n=1 Tax=Micromonospora sp. CB01531 TaxID=1718947 RepID=UPI000A4312E5|nr:hypothetical protein [Micromonospora sp. CB01531]
MSEQSVSVVHFGGSDDGDTAEAVAEMLRAHRFTTRVVKAQESRSDAGSLALIVLVAIPLHGFLSALGESLGGATGAALQTLFGRVFARLHDGRTEQRSIIIRDAARGIDAEIRAGLPGEAFEQLRALVIGDSVKLRYDSVAGAWAVVDK